MIVMMMMMMIVKMMHVHRAKEKREGSRAGEGQSGCMATPQRTDTLLTVTARLALPGVTSSSAQSLPRAMSAPAAAL